MEKKSPLVSIIITNFNKEKYIYQTIKSAINQKYKKFEVIVIDNFSSDNSCKIISKFKNVKLLFNNQKKTGALNQIKSIEIGLKNCRGSIICFKSSSFLSLSPPLKNETLNRGSLKREAITSSAPSLTR